MVAKSLSLKQATQKIEKLREEIKYHEKKYYVDSTLEALGFWGLVCDLAEMMKFVPNTDLPY